LAGAPLGRVMRWSPAEGQPARLMWLTPMNDGQPEPSCYALAICDMEHNPEIAPELLGKMFRLTKAELRLALQMLAGRTPAEAAREMEVTIHTVRTYLKRLYLKVGVKSQASLVRKLLQTTSLTTSAA
jgi:DNA-binding CsgD family transcriptional regulator